MMPGIGTRFGTQGLSIGPHRGKSTTTAEFPTPTGSTKTDTISEPLQTRSARVPNSPRALRNRTTEKNPEPANPSNVRAPANATAKTIAPRQNPPRLRTLPDDPPTPEPAVGQKVRTPIRIGRIKLALTCIYSDLWLRPRQESNLRPWT